MAQWLMLCLLFTLVVISVTDKKEDKAKCTIGMPDNTVCGTDRVCAPCDVNIKVKCLKVLGTSCKKSKDCAGFNTECSGDPDKICRCEDGYSERNGNCLPDIGTECFDIYKCFDEFAQCIDGTCRCKSGYTLIGGTCKPELGSPCSLNSNDCHGDNTQCICDTDCECTCQCNPGYAPKDDNYGCGALLGTQCNDISDCFVSVNSECVGTCNCKTNFSPNSDNTGCVGQRQGFRCAPPSSQCLERTKLCDGSNDCTGLSEESLCTAINALQCHPGGPTFTRDNICDGICQCTEPVSFCRDEEEFFCNCNPSP